MGFSNHLFMIFNFFDKNYQLLAVGMMQNLRDITRMFLNFHSKKHIHTSEVQFIYKCCHHVHIGSNFFMVHHSWWKGCIGVLYFDPHQYQWIKTCRIFFMSMFETTTYLEPSILFTLCPCVWWNMTSKGM
jgi:hypothetical protein